MELDEFSGASTNPCLDLVKMIGASQLISSIVGKQLNIIPNHKWKHKQTPEVVEVDHKNFTQFSVNNTHPNIFLPTTTIQPSKADLSFLWWGGGSFSSWWFQTHLTNIRQIETSSPKYSGEMNTNIWNHQLVICSLKGYAPKKKAPLEPKADSSSTDLPRPFATPEVLSRL